jgi:hypothetical protein
MGSKGEGSPSGNRGFDYSNDPLDHHRGRQDRRTSVRNYGRRESDIDPGRTATNKFVVLTVVIVDALYLAGDAILFGSRYC